LKREAVPAVMEGARPMASHGLNKGGTALHETKPHFKSLKQSPPQEHEP
jgi:hypothetical protein